MAPKTWGMSKEEAGYRPAPKPEVTCKVCQWMFPRLSLGSCKYVRGIVSADATCNEFERKRPHGGS